MRLRKSRVNWSTGFQPPTAGGCACCRRLQCSSRAGVSTDVSVEKLLDSFWEARGVFDPEQRRRLVDSARNIPQQPGAVALQPDQPLPGVPATWQDTEDVPQVAEASRRLLQLRQILGGSEQLDVVWMVVREPGLLTADYVQLTRRLFQMKIALGSSGVDVLAVVEKQPGLLLQGGEGAIDADNLKEVLQAWEYGLAADGEGEWAEKLQELRRYKDGHGDVHVGFRPGDNADLARWASKQRAAWKRGELEGARVSQLQALGFEFDEDEAEWLRWYKDLCVYHQQHGHCNPPPLATGVDFYLINWCSVQRVAMRTRVLKPGRVALLDDISFDWTGADPLS